MAEPTNPPGGGVPPKPGEAAKIQPKKETVRISLPPKPTSAPTVRLPGPAPGGIAAPTAAVAAPTAGAAAPPAPPAAAAAPVAAGAAAVSVPPVPAPAAAAKPAATVAPARPAVAPASAPAPSVSTAPRPMAPAARISGLDLGLAVAAAVLGIGVAGYILFLAMN